MMIHPKAPTDAEAKAPTCVWWDINRCSVPADVDARMVGPCIKTAMKNLGYAGPLTITAIGRLTEVSGDVLRAIYSTGIGLHHVPTDNGIDLELFLWGWNNPPPANLMLISDYRIFGHTLAALRSRGYNDICPSYLASASASAFNYISFGQSFLAMLRAGELKEEVEDKCSEKSILVCSTCDDKVKDFESFITHLKSTEHAREKILPCYGAGMMMHPKVLKDAEAKASTIQKIPTCFRAGMMIHPKAPTDAEAEAPTWVWWDITRCPVPAGVDAGIIGPCIKSAVNNLGYMGPLRITAIGILTDVPLDVLRAIYSFGIALHHVPTDMSGIKDALFWWGFENPSPSNVMLLSAERVFGVTLASLERKGFNIIRSLFPYDASKIEYALNLSFTLEGCFFLWHSLLTVLRSDVNEFEKEERGESSLVCSTCDDKADVKDLESFITHLYSKEHGLEELEFYPQACRSYEKDDATTIKRILTCFRAGIKSCQRLAEDEYKAEDELKKQKLNVKQKMTNTRQ